MLKRDCMNLLRLGIPLLFLTLIACSDGNDNGSSSGADAPRPQLELALTEPPIDLPGIAAAYSTDVRYGDAERNVLDIYLPDSDEPTPLVIYFHGGAYVQGDKNGDNKIIAEDIRAFLEAGIAFATINYSFINTDPPYDDEGVIKPLLDSARALQFLRYHYQSLNLDPEQVASYGISAGASTSLWLGTHDDLADPDNADPVLRESSRLKAVGALYTQGTLNFLRWQEILAPVVEPIFPDTNLLTVAAALGADALLFAATGTDSLEELEAPEKLPYMENIDVIGLMDAGDAPIYAYNDSNIFEDDLLNLFLHHALHVIAIFERAQEVGLENVMYAIDPQFPLEDPSGEDHISFLKRHIQ